MDLSNNPSFGMYPHERHTILSSQPSTFAKKKRKQNHNSSNTSPTLQPRIPSAVNSSLNSCWARTMNLSLPCLRFTDPLAPRSAVLAANPNPAAATGAAVPADTMVKPAAVMAAAPTKVMTATSRRIPPLLTHLSKNFGRRFFASPSPIRSTRSRTKTWQLFSSNT
ncbi:hypothetical protein MCOR25_005177 [Pyricularia grisea]|nr:hypothetical protein MCOR25_005177 [Pyricularia grisea]